MFKRPDRYRYRTPTRNLSSNYPPGKFGIVVTLSAMI
jgi:hypothetical protein